VVYDKKRSGDPDYDDKVPMDQHAAKVVTAGDGTPVAMTMSNGPVNAVTGEHVNLDDPRGDELDNRPAPGEVATEPSRVQTYSAEDTPTADNDLGEVGSQDEAESAVESSKSATKAARTAAGRTSTTK
jgi:hypothetical protein